MSTELYRTAIDPATFGGDTERADLMRRVWEPTPWIADVWTGGFSEEFGREMAIREWCNEQFGPECFVIGGVGGKWQRGSATIHGWSWIGFATESMMIEFLKAWPAESRRNEA